MSAEQLHAMKQQALTLLRGNRLAEAQALFSQVCAQSAEDVDAWYFLSCIHGMQGNMDDAEQCCQRVIALRPDHSEAHVNLGNVLLSQGKLEEAVRHYQTAVRSNPNNTRALVSLGNALSSLGDHSGAAESYQAALRISPNFAEIYFGLGNSQMAQNKYDEAIDSFRHAIGLNPNYAAAYNNLGNAYKELGDNAAATENYRTAVRLQPDYTLAYNNLAIVLKERGMLREAYDAAQQALRIQPDSADAHISLGNISLAQGRADTAIEHYEHLLNILPDHAEAHTSLCMMMHFRPEYAPEQLFKAAREWGMLHASKIQPLPPPGNTPDAQRCLRVGYVSGDFYSHPVGYFIEPVLANHDGSRYETFCYYNHDKHDALTARLQQAVHHWCNIAGQSDDTVVNRIRDDGIDILIDLSGHTTRNRLLAFARKPAPIQATWLGYFDTTGLETMDYIIADRFVIPPEQERYYVEQVIRMPNAYECFSPPDAEIEPGGLPALATGTVTFGCFNQPAKLTEAVVTCWSRLLHALPQSELYLKYKSFEIESVRERYQSLFADQGIDISRIKFSGYSPRNEFLASYCGVDIALDPFPYNGGVTTFEALWMGVPVITMHGDHFVSCVGETLLRNMGFTEGVGDSEEDYVARAIALASDLPRLAELRSGLRDRLLNSPMCDGAGFTRDLEAAYRRAWEAWCRAQQPPA